jgi:DNA-binding XRE family transcriptional regulator
MAEVFKSKRIFFPKGLQKQFIIRVKEDLGLTWNKLAEILGVSARNLNDWKNEKISMPLNAAKTISAKTRIKLPNNIQIKDRFWYVKKGAKLGGLAVYKKYGHIGGNQKIREKKWREWWEKIGKFNSELLPNKTLPFKKPRKSEQLAEFVGIMLGDGGISKYQITVTLHDKDDLEYSKLVLKIIKKLFGINPSVYHDEKDSVNTIVISRSTLIKFLTDKIGLKIGNKIKQQVDIPDWVKKNKKFKVACLRGLMDTDGCLVLHKYKVRDKEYCYKKLEFCSASKPLVKSVINILKEFDFRPRLSHNGKNVWIDNKNEVKRYFKIINSNNPKHRNRFLG